ncbi:Glutaryl-7-ACA acylase [Granulicella sibirica]|uniref:Glutaryl-7-ACA acylase n=2 Tax=Granulicella sibirica TaxID=2479048 RepID=A0A4Q0T017_9BACT|nr:Glutaryl-7-ACA acylase [Granulicella sibirica]
MIPMRDGIRLNTIILIPNSATPAAHAPILITRTPYSAAILTTNSQSSHLGSSLFGYDNAIDVIVDGGYIRVIQDVRGKYGSEGDYVMNRPFHGPLNPTPVDHATDTYDTIDWLIKNVPESNGKVGILGISYDGFTTLAALVHPHPALKVAVPMNPMVDGWRGDDWFHNGAFRQQNMSYIYEQDGSRSNDLRWWTSNFDDYDMFLNATSAGELGRQRGLDQMGFWRKVKEHPAYDSFWQNQAMDQILAAQPLTVPTLLVHSLWDAEDIYGAMAVYKALKPKDTATGTPNEKLFLAMGPWHHGGSIDDGSTLGAIRFNQDTSLWFRKNVLGPFLARNLKDESPDASPIAPVTVYESGADIWQKLPSWPAVCTEAPNSVPAAQPCATPPARLYLQPNGTLSFTAPASANSDFTEYVSDPMKPVPFRARPIQPVCYDAGCTWANWLADDQREQSGRPDVAVFSSEVLTKPVTISGEPIANLIASTSGTDSDWVVKLIDVYPDEVASQPKMGSYQLMISADIFRGRYRESLSTPQPIPANTPEPYRFALPNANHVFEPGHRIMVQVQSSWFPLYDRNPQTYVPTIFEAKPADYRKATQHLYHSPTQPSYIEVPMVTVP